ncbi:predicted protein [Streptomyces sp. AA4]|nr:predicted protein [Streptomyces sp. AA4]
MPPLRGALWVRVVLLPGVAPEWVVLHRLTSASLAPTLVMITDKTGARGKPLVTEHTIDLKPCL